MSSEVKRYDVDGQVSCNSEGDWVRYDDYAALEAECERLTDELDRRSVIQGDCIARCQRLADERDALATELAEIKGKSQ